MNRQFGSSWLDIAVAIAVDYEILFRRYVELQRVTLDLLVQLDEARQLRDFAERAVEERFGNREAA